MKLTGTGPGVLLCELLLTHFNGTGVSLRGGIRHLLFFFFFFVCLSYCGVGLTSLLAF